MRETMRDVYKWGPHRYEMVCHDLNVDDPWWTVTVMLANGTVIVSKKEWTDSGRAHDYAKRLCRGALFTADND